MNKTPIDPIDAAQAAINAYAKPFRRLVKYIQRSDVALILTELAKLISDVEAIVDPTKEALRATADVHPDTLKLFDTLGEVAATRAKHTVKVSYDPDLLPSIITDNPDIVVITKTVDVDRLLATLKLELLSPEEVEAVNAASKTTEVTPSVTLPALPSSAALEKLAKIKLTPPKRASQRAKDAAAAAAQAE